MRPDLEEAKELLGVFSDEATPGAWERLARGAETLAGKCASTATVTVLQAASVAYPLSRYGGGAFTADAAAVGSGVGRGAVLLPEAPNGSGDLRWPVRAERDGEELILNGECSWVPGGGVADVFLVHAQLDEQAVAMVVPGGAAGLHREAVVGLGLHHAEAARVRLESVRVPADHVLGGDAGALEAARDAHTAGRFALAALSVGVGAAALEAATLFAIEERGGAAPATRQSVQWHIADSLTELEVARLLVRQVATRRDEGAPHALETALARLAAGAAANLAGGKSLQILGSEGAIAGNVVEQAERDARMLSLLGTSPQYERGLVVDLLLDEDSQPSDLPAVSLTEEQSMLRELIRDFTRSEVAPQAAEHEKAGKFPRELVLRLWNEVGIGAMLASEEYGGMDLDPVSYNLVVEELAREWPSLSIIVAVHNSVNVQLIDLHGTEEQKRKYLPRLAEEWVGAFSLSEPGAGSDVAALRAVAVRDGDEYVLNGEKNWVTNGGAADIYVLFAKTDPQAGHRGITAFLVERGTPGLTISKPERKMGIKCSEAVSLALEDCRIPLGNRLGEEGEGFRIAMMELDGGRIGVASQALGISGGAMDRSLRYAQERVAFGRPIAKFQAIQEMLAEMALRIRGSRLLVHQAATLRGDDKPHSLQASMAKLYATESSTWVSHRAIQIHGGYGYTEDYEVERFYRDARVTEIYEGTSEIQRMVIARNWLKEHGFTGR